MKKILKFFQPILFLFITFLFLLSRYIKGSFSYVTFDQILFSLRYSEGTSPSVLKSALKYLLPRLAILLIFATILNIFIYYIVKKYNGDFFDLNIFRKNIKLNFNRFIKFFKKSMYFIILIVLLFISLVNFGVFTYIKNQFQYTKIYDKYYVDPKNVKVTFPKNKRNLIYIIVESAEMTGASKKNGGGLSKSIIPNLERISIENTNFSNDDDLGGAYCLEGVSYTASSLVGQTSGAPLRANFNGEDYYGYNDFYSGFYSIGEILEKNGYKNYFLLGSDADFAGRKSYFLNHGNYKIMDYYYAIDNKWISKNYKVWWGYEDKKLFKFAKQELLRISNNDEPFNFTMLTADTHFVDGYLDKSCKNNIFDDQYSNVFHCNDKMLFDFINWVKEQDFYENTSIIIVGDHFTAQSDFYENRINKNYDRTIYNAFINSAIDSNSNVKNRVFSSFDMYPTTLASLGATIEGDQLGFGVNLYSGKKTVLEEAGLYYFNDELKKKSNYYNNKLIGKEYYEISNKNVSTNN